MTQTQNLTTFKYAYLLLGIVGLAWPSWWVLAFWLVFAIGNGTVGHRYFAHSAFSVSRPMHWILAVWCTISAYSPAMYWVVQHRHHHKHTDKPEDIHGPHRGIFNSIIGWALDTSVINSVFIDRSSMVNLARAKQDRAIKWSSQYFILINILFLIALAIIDLDLALAAGAANLIEHVRLGLVNTVCHIEGFPGNYRNHQTKDHSQNNLLLGWLGLGFGWHNNHHHDASQLTSTERWWEIDIEGLVGKTLSKF